MKEYVKPDAILVAFESNDVCTASGVNGTGGLKFEDYDHDGKWL